MHSLHQDQLQQFLVSQKFSFLCQSGNPIPRASAELTGGIPAMHVDPIAFR